MSRTLRVRRLLRRLLPAACLARSRVRTVSRRQHKLRCATSPDVVPWRNAVANRAAWRVLRALLLRRLRAAATAPYAATTTCVHISRTLRLRCPYHLPCFGAYSTLPRTTCLPTTAYRLPPLPFAACTAKTLLQTPHSLPLATPLPACASLLYTSLLHLACRLAFYHPPP